MKKKILDVVVLLLTFMIGMNIVDAKEVDVNVEIYWGDSKDYYKARPDSVTVPMVDDFDDDADVIYLELNKDDAEIVEKNTMSIWKFNVKVNIKSDKTYFLGTPKAIDNYTIDETVSDGKIDSDGGTVTVFYFVKTAIISTATVNYHDDNNRDAYSRDFSFWVLEEDDNTYPYPTRQEFDLTNKADYGGSFTDKDTQQFPLYLNSVKSVDVTSEDFMVPQAYKIHVLTDSSGIKYRWDGYDLYFDVYYSASKIKVPLEVVWDDNDNKNNKRPQSISVSAYDQEDRLEDTFEIDNSWKIEKELFKNMKYSNGKAIDYQFKIREVDNYLFSVELVDGTYIITGKYIGEDISSREENPETGDNISTYIILFITSLISIEIITIYRKRVLK